MIAEKGLKALAEASSDAIIVSDYDGKIRFWNKSAQTIFGYSPEEIIGKSLSILIPEQTRPAHEAGMEKLHKTGEGKVFGKTHELEGLRKNGEVFPLELSISRWQQGGKEFYGSIIRDITKRKSLEEHVRQSQYLEALGRVSGGIARDFNNLLTVLLAEYEQLQSLEPQTLSFTRKIREIQEIILQASDLARQLLVFSRPVSMHKKIVNLNGLINDFEKIAHRFIKENIFISLVLDPSIGPILVDLSQTQVALLNLIVNARDAMPNGGTITIKTSMEKITEPKTTGSFPIPSGNYVKLTIIDTGEGMTDETRAHCLEPFFTTKELHKGTGLGLPIVLGIVQQSQGYINVESQVGKGSQINLYFPEVSQEEIEMMEQKKKLPRHKGEESPTILVAEDEPKVLDICTKILQHEGYNVYKAKNGEEGSRFIQNPANPKIDLLVTDISLPYIGGPSLAEIYRKKYPEGEVLFMSGYIGSPADFQLFETIGEHFIEKPFSTGAFLSKVRSILEEESLCSVEEKTKTQRSNI